MALVTPAKPAGYSTRLTGVADRLSDLSRRATLVPRRIDWPDELPADALCFAPELCSLYGQPAWDAMGEAERRRLCFFECLNFFSLNIHGEKSLLEGLPLDVKPNPNFAYYYGTIDFEFWLRKYLSEDMVQWLKKNVHPLDLVYKLAQDHAIVLLNGGGFSAPSYSVRVSFANLPDDVYDDIGRGVRAVARGYVEAYAAQGGKVGDIKLGAPAK